MIHSTESAIRWPQKRNLFGVGVSPVTCEEACRAIMPAAQSRVGGVVSAFSVHALIEAAARPASTEQANRFAIITPDGQPVRWALNWLHAAGLRESLRGSDLMLELCQLAADSGVSIYLYGSSPETLSALQANLLERFEGLVIAGAESPPFRPLSAEEDAQMIERVNASGAGLMFLGLGCPKQDHFAAAHVDSIQAVQLCVGAAFDFIAGTKSAAPAWMQRHGLEWFFRLCQEPRRLWKRYLVTNTVFLVKLAEQLLRQRMARLSLRAPGAAESRSIWGRGSQQAAAPHEAASSLQPPDRLALYRALFDEFNQAALIIDGRDGRIIDANQSACTRLQTNRPQLLARHWSDIEAGMPEARRRNLDVAERLFVMLTDEPAPARFERRALPIDSLTGLPNRDALTQRTDSDEPADLPSRMALLFIDLDGFKQVNDSLGHLVGDRVLRIVAERLAASVRPADLLVRYGGDEFVVLADGLHRQSDLERLARRITRNVRQPLVIDGQTLIVSASVGIARRTAQQETLEALIAEADRAMYRAKQLGREEAAASCQSPIAKA